jgi:hypothetical protein
MGQYRGPVHPWASAVVLVLLSVVATVLVPGAAQGAPPQPGGSLDIYRATVDAPKAAQLRAQGVDVTAERQLGGGKVLLDLVLTATEQAALAAEGVDASLVRVPNGGTAASPPTARRRRDTTSGATTTGRAASTPPPASWPKPTRSSSSWSRWARRSRAGPSLR